MDKTWYKSVSHVLNNMLNIIKALYIHMRFYFNDTFVTYREKYAFVDIFLEHLTVMQVVQSPDDNMNYFICEYMYFTIC